MAVINWKKILKVARKSCQFSNVFKNLRLAIIDNKTLNVLVFTVTSQTWRFSQKLITSMGIP